MLWYSILCLAIGINLNTMVSFYPSNLWSLASNPSEFTKNVFLFSFPLVSLCMTQYSVRGISKLSTHFRRYSTIINLFLCAAAIFVPSFLVVPLYLASALMAVVTYAFAIQNCYSLYNSTSKTYIYSIISYWALLCSAVPGIILFCCKRNFLSSRVMFMPLFIISHTIMMTRQYTESIEHTKKLSSSLSETIQKISHSNNALMCTQMNADFLYDTLDLIKQKCDEDAFVAEDLTVSLSKYLRHTLNFQQLKGMVALSNEIELTKAYISIAREKYPNITFDLRLPDPLPQISIPPLSIQPLVENAIIHGLCDKEDGGRITLTIVPYREYYHIDVSDNGKGFTDEISEIAVESIAPSAHIGLFSIHKRLIGLFGKGLVIQSAPGVGSSVSFVVPPIAPPVEEGEATTCRS